MSMFRELLMAKQNDSYVTDGLVFWIDGINNTGNGHSASAAAWVDLIGGNNIPIDLNYVTWDNTLCRQTVNNYLTAKSARNIFSQSSGEFSVEVVFKITTNDVWAAKLRPDGGVKPWWQISYYGSFGVSYANGIDGDKAVTFSPSSQLMSVTSVISNNSFSVYKNSGILSSSAISSAVRPLRTLDLFYFWGQHSKTGTEIGTVRIYDKALSASEIARNYKIDKKRFNLA